MKLDQDTLMLIIKIVCGTVSGICAILSVLSALFGGKWKGLYKNVKAVNDKTNKLIELIEEAESSQEFENLFDEKNDERHGKHITDKAYEKCLPERYSQKNCSDKTASEFKYG